MEINDKEILEKLDKSAKETYDFIRKLISETED